MLACQLWRHTEAIWTREWQHKNVLWWKSISSSPDWRAKKAFRSQCNCPGLLEGKIYSLSAQGIYISANFSSVVSYWFIGTLFILRTGIVIYIANFGGQLVICLVNVWSFKYIGSLIAYIFPFIGSVIAAFFREALSNPKLYFYKSLILSFATFTVGFSF